MGLFEGILIFYGVLIPNETILRKMHSQLNKSVWCASKYFLVDITTFDSDTRETGYLFALPRSIFQVWIDLYGIQVGDNGTVRKDNLIQFLLKYGESSERLNIIGQSPTEQEETVIRALIGTDENFLINRNNIRWYMANTCASTLDNTTGFGRLYPIQD